MKEVEIRWERKKLWREIRKYIDAWDGLEGKTMGSSHYKSFRELSRRNSTWWFSCIEGNESEVESHLPVQVQKGTSLTWELKAPGKPTLFSCTREIQLALGAYQGDVCNCRTTVECHLRDLVNEGCLCCNYRWTREFSFTDQVPWWFLLWSPDASRKHLGRMDASEYLTWKWTHNGKSYLTVYMPQRISAEVKVIGKIHMEGHEEKEEWCGRPVLLGSLSCSSSYTSLLRQVKYTSYSNCWLQVQNTDSPDCRYFRETLSAGKYCWTCTYHLPESAVLPDKLTWCNG